MVLSVKIRKLILMILIIISSIFIAYALVMTWMATSHTVKTLNETYADTTMLRNGTEFIFMHDSIFKLQKEEIFLNSRLMMTKNDSICMTIDLLDSLLMLELQGVSIHLAKIQKIKTSPVFTKISRTALVQMFSRPFQVDTCRSTIVKEPILIKKAPADTIEAAQQGPLRDTIPPPPAAYHLYLEQDLIVMVVQTDITEERNPVYRAFNRKNRMRQRGQILRDLFRFRFPDYTPWILIYLPQDDVITTYRALPLHAQVTVGM